MTKDQFEESLINSFPLLFLNKPNIQCGTGWFGLIQKTCEHLYWFLEKHPELEPSIKITSIKERFGLLHIKADSNVRIISNLILIKDVSGTVCEVCGNSAMLRKDLKRWKTLCEVHYEKMLQGL